MLAAMTDAQFDRWEAFYRLQSEGTMREHVHQSGEAMMRDLKQTAVR